MTTVLWLMDDANHFTVAISGEGPFPDRAILSIEGNTCEARKESGTEPSDSGQAGALYRVRINTRNAPVWSVLHQRTEPRGDRRIPWMRTRVGLHLAPR